MTKILIMTGSVREGRAADAVLSQVQEALKKYPKLEAELADLKVLDLPFFNSSLIPSDENYAPTNPGVKKLSQLVTDADKVLILTPEYNHSTPAVLKNAIDWLYHEWKDKPIGLIGYGWVGGARSIKHLHTVFENLKPELIHPEANLRFKKEINLDGSAIDNSSAAAIDQVLAAL